jgi:pimeloyl-ACP methyl ester carboxylesterase
MPKIRLDNGLQLHYIASGDGPDVVMLHGLGGNLAVWHLGIIPALRERFRTITYDLRGHGYSDMPPTGYTAEDMAHDLSGLLDKLNIERCVLVGHSYGGDIALNFALLHPERAERIVAIEASLPALAQLRKRDEWEGWQYWSELLERYGLHVPPEHRSDIGYLLRATAQLPKLWGPMRGHARDAAAVLRTVDETTVVHDYEVVGQLTLENVRRVQTPVLLIYGDGSPYLASYDYLRTNLPDSKAVLLPKSAHGHFGPLEQPDTVAGCILDWLEAEVASR